MTDKEPTLKQLKEFWEWCGFQHHIPDVAKNLTAERYKEEQWFVPGVYCGGIPDIDLKNLFKYAVPKTIELLISRNEGWTEARAIHYLFQAWELEYSWRKSTFEDALFWVVWEVIKK